MNSVPAISHQYADWPTILCSIQNLTNGRSVLAELSVDTGANGTCLDERIAVDLGLDLGPIEPVSLRGFGGDAYGRPALVEVTPMAREEFRMRLEAVFLPGIAETLGNILGLDWFANVDVTLSHYNNLIELRLPA